MSRSFRLLGVVLVLLAAPQTRGADPAAQSSTGIVVRLGAGLAQQPLDGRLLLLISKDDAREPRFQVSATSLSSAQVFGLDVEGLKAGDERTFDVGVLGYPLGSLSALPPGEYTAQALLHKYETFRLSTGHTVKLPMDRGEGQQWNRAPGNLYSTPQKIRWDGGRGDAIRLEIDKTIPPLTDPTDTKYVKHVRIRSELLSKFWGRDMHLGAHVLLPEGFDAHPNAKYPLIINHGHFPANLGNWRDTPPDANLKCEYSERFQLDCYNRIQQQAAYDFFKEWTGPNFPRVLVIEIQHANPYYDDSYAVNSANLGPYGDAIMKELVPHIEKQFRGIGAGWARATYGGSTGGWEALAVQIFYPDDFNAAYAACPDPIDFRAYTVVDIYNDANAYWAEGPFMKVPRPGHRNYLGHLTSTLEQMNRMELALGTKTRSGQQWDIWEAVYSPQGPDGYPVRLWDKRTGVIDKKVAEDLEGALRPFLDPAPRLEPRAGSETSGQDPPLCRRHGQLLPEQRGVSGRRLPQEHQGSPLRRRGRVRRPRRALLERRPDTRQRLLAASLPSDVHPQVRRAGPQDGTFGGRRAIVALLS